MPLPIDPDTALAAGRLGWLPAASGVPVTW